MSEAAADPRERISVLVPFYDERDNLRRFPDEVYPILDSLGIAWELVLVDDGSADDSLAIARGLAAEDDRVRLCVHERNRGLGAAVATGIAAATGSCIVTLDADLTFAPSQIASLLERYGRGDVDLVIGSPTLAGYEYVPLYRIALSRIANFMYQVAIGRRLTAVTPIFRLYRAALVREVEVEATGFDVNAELLVKLLRRGARVAEVPAKLSTRCYGVSKLDNRREIANHLRLLAKIVRWRFVAR